MTWAELKEKSLQTRDRILFRAKDITGKAANGIRSGVQWAAQNPKKAAELAASGAILLGGANKLVRGIHRNVTVRHEMEEKRHRIYDHSMNAYLYTKRPLRAKDIEFINAERRRTGKRVSEILSDMDLLRR